MNKSSHWHDLMPRLLSAAAMIVIGGVALALGGFVFVLLVCLLCGTMTWEASRMFDAPAPLSDGVLAGGALLLSYLLPWGFVLPLLLAAAFVGAGRAGRDKPLLLIFVVWILIACFAIIFLREQAGFVWMLWLIGLVVVSDVAGYFAGRALGGPKFWPRISPKKTWSGTIAGWIGAGILGALFARLQGLGLILVPVSIVVALAGQMGDIAESAIKRRMNVKDSSGLIPGHGGVLDRFDGLLGASVVAFGLWMLLLVAS